MDMSKGPGLSVDPFTLLDGVKLGYQSPTPLPDILDPAALEGYSAVCALLLRLRCASQALQEVHQLPVFGFGGRGAQRTPLAALQRKVDLLRAELGHFLSCLEHYVRVDILEKESIVLERQIASLVTEALEGQLTLGRDEEPLRTVDILQRVRQMHREHLRQILQACLLVPDLSTVLADLHQLLAMAVRLKDILQQMLQQLQTFESARQRPSVESAAVEQALDAAQASADLAAAEGFEPENQVAAAANAAADAAGSLNLPMGAQVAVAAVAAARIAVELQMSQDDAADAAASCSERVTQAMGQNADVQAQAADAAAIIAGYLVASHVGEGPIAAGLEAGRAMRAAGSTAREQLLAAGDAAMHAASAANVPTELQLVAAATAIGRTAAVGRIRSSRVEYCKLITELAEQASTMPGHGTDEATLVTAAEAAAVQDPNMSIEEESQDRRSSKVLDKAESLRTWNLACHRKGGGE
ncbi:unnamed protein product [Symbiodinium natans]|uniref:Spindle pole body component n=1 Tax=Symbiodinium natans TaxID=878477 RepID=A0A812TS53_9DINO|nr:unnamed protein product [Symbiodinium natans]